MFASGAVEGGIVEPHSGQVPLVLPVRLYPQDWQLPMRPLRHLRIVSQIQPHGSTAAATATGAMGTTVTVWEPVAFALLRGSLMFAVPCMRAKPR